MLGFLLFFTYKKVFKNGGYKLKFNINLLITVFVTTMLMTIIRNNVATSVGLLGVISVVRFRVKIKDYRDISFILWAIGIGIAIGTKSYFLGLLYSLIISITLIILNRHFLNLENVSLMIIRGNKINKSRLEEIIEKNCNEFKLSFKQEKENYTEYIYNIDLNKKDIIKLKEKILDCIDTNFVKFI
ncbi:DUF4956 domain-containing protein [Fusobacterium sp.]|uniref:DUF4956 domain-containing protein n=1 Tax=Fusobacterium sp. TaxID=68766 RepID=UPI00262B4A46|nr:DUF4956 domain-containing protein [Fusobacterium sp.]